MTPRPTRRPHANREYTLPNFLIVIAVLFGYVLHAMAEPADIKGPTVSPTRHSNPPFFDTGLVYPTATLAHARIVIQHAEMSEYGNKLVSFWTSHKQRNGYSDSAIRFVDRAQARTISALAELKKGADALEQPNRRPPKKTTNDLPIHNRQPRQAPGINVNLDVGSGLTALFHGIKSLFGISETQELKETQSHLIHRTDLLADDFEKMDRFVTQLKTSIQYDFFHIRNETSKVRADHKRFEHAVLLADAFQTVTQFCLRIARALQSLTAGRLTTDLISLADADLVIDNLAKTTSANGLTLGLGDALNFYLSQFTTSITPEAIDVLVSVPAFDPNRPFRLFEFSPVPVVPASPSAMPQGLWTNLKLEDTTLDDPLWLVESATWLAVSDGLPNERETAVWTAEDFNANCRRFSAKEFYCLNSFIIKEASSSCLPSLFLGLPSFSTTCDFHRIVAASPLYQFSTSGHLVTYHSEDTPLEVACGTHRSYHTIFGLTSFLPPAGCTLATPTWSLPALPSMSTSSNVFIPPEYKLLNFGPVDEMSLENVTVLEDHTLHIETLPDMAPPMRFPPLPPGRRAVPWIAIGLAALALALVVGFLVYLYYTLDQMQAGHPAPAPPAGPIEDGIPLQQHQAGPDQPEDPPHGEVD